MSRGLRRGTTLTVLLTFIVIASLAVASLVSAQGSSESVGADGGTLIFHDVTVKVPDGALSSTVNLVYLPETSDSLAISLGAQNASGQWGTATLTAQGAQTEVVLSLSSGTLQSEAVHIHEGSCDRGLAAGTNLGDVAHALTFFSGGSGETTTVVPASLASLRDGQFAINAHEAGNPGTYTACGNLTASRPAPNGTLFGSQIFSLDVLDSNGVYQTTQSFSGFIQVTVPYTDADKAQASGGRDDNVDLYVYDAAFKRWNRDASAIQDVVNKSLTSSQTALGAAGASGFAIVITPPAGAVPGGATPPAAGDIAPGSGLLIGIALAGAILILGGGYLFRRGSRARGA